LLLFSTTKTCCNRSSPIQKLNQTIKSSYSNNSEFIHIFVSRKRPRTDDYGLNEIGVVRTGVRGTIGGFLKRAQRTLLDTPWQIIQVFFLISLFYFSSTQAFNPQIVETGQPGLFRVWALIGSDLHQVKVVVPRVFYVNQVNFQWENGRATNYLNFYVREIQKKLERVVECGEK